MKTDCCCCCDKAKLAAWCVAVLGIFLLMAVLVKVMLNATAPPPVDQVRAAERAKALADVTAAGAEALASYGIVDQTKGIYRLPIAQAMKTIVTEYQNPAAARTNLMARLEKATAVPPKAPEKPSVYE